MCVCAYAYGCVHCKLTLVNMCCNELLLSWCRPYMATPSCKINSQGKRGQHWAPISPISHFPFVGCHIELVIFGKSMPIALYAGLTVCVSVCVSVCVCVCVSVLIVAYQLRSARCLFVMCRHLFFFFVLFLPQLQLLCCRLHLLIAT